MSSIISYRENEDISKHIELNHLTKLLSGMIKNQVNAVKPVNKNAEKKSRTER